MKKALYRAYSMKNGNWELHSIDRDMYGDVRGQTFIGSYDDFAGLAMHFRDVADTLDRGEFSVFLVWKLPTNGFGLATTYSEIDITDF